MNREEDMPDDGTKTKRAIIYLRVSTNDQVQTDYDADGFSIRAQREACERKANDLGAVVVEEFCDRGESAKSADRADLQRMLAYLRTTGNVDLVVCHKVDRLARSREDDMAIVVAIRQAGAQLVSATENIDDTPQGKLLHGIMATIAEFYSANLASEARKGMLQKVQSGGTISMAPVGYLNARERLGGGKEIRTVVVDPERAHHIQWAFEAYASGEWSMLQLADALTRRGFRSRGSRGGRTDAPITPSYVEVFLKNPYYTGIVTFEGVEYPGRHQALIDRETFERVQAIRHSRALSREKIHKHPNYLKGSVWCGQCGDRLGVVNAHGNGGVYPYFYCIGRAKKRTGCTFRHVLIDEVERKVEVLWRRVQLPEERIAEIRDQASAELRHVYDLSQVEFARQRRRLAALQHERTKAKEAYYADAMPLAEFRSEQRRISREEEEAERIIRQCQMERSELEEALEEALSLLGNAYELYQRAAPTIRRQLNQAVWGPFTVHEEGVRADLALPFGVLLTPQQAGGHEAVEASVQPAPADDASVSDASLFEAQFTENNNRAPLWERGSNLVYMVGDTGFEPVTSSVSRKRAPTAPIARMWCEVETGFEPVYTALQAVASPLGHSTEVTPRRLVAASLRADDGIRTRDPHLGKVMRYQLRYVRTTSRDVSRRRIRTLAESRTNCQLDTPSARRGNDATARTASRRRHREDNKATQTTAKTTRRRGRQEQTTARTGTRRRRRSGYAAGDRVAEGVHQVVSTVFLAVPARRGQDHRGAGGDRGLVLAEQYAPDQRLVVRRAPRQAHQAGGHDPQAALGEQGRQATWLA